MVIPLQIFYRHWWGAEYVWVNQIDNEGYTAIMLAYILQSSLFFSWMVQTLWRDARCSDCPRPPHTVFVLSRNFRLINYNHAQARKQKQTILERLIGKTFFTHTMTIVGTPGYICSHYAVLLEIIPGMLFMESESLDRSLTTDTLVNLSHDGDPLSCKNDKRGSLFFNLASLALACVATLSNQRPSIMETVVKRSWQYFWITWSV